MYLQKLINRRNNGEVKVITGSRRCGKSWLLSKIYTNWLLSQGVDKENIILITFDTDDLEETRDLTEAISRRIFAKKSPATAKSTMCFSTRFKKWMALRKL